LASVITCLYCTPPPPRSFTSSWSSWPIRHRFGRWSPDGIEGGTPMTGRDLSRRALLAASGVTLLGACGWDGGKTLAPVLGAGGRFNDWLSERLLSSSRTAARFSKSRWSRYFPSYHISDITPELDRPE